MVHVGPPFFFQFLELYVLGVQNAECVLHVADLDRDDIWRLTRGVLLLGLQSCVEVEIVLQLGL